MRAALLACVLLIASCAQSQPSSPRAELKSGGIVEYKMPNSLPNGASCFRCGHASLGGIAAGADGNLWFVDYCPDKGGRITPSGALTEFPIPTRDSAPRGIVSGPNHAVWFVESGFNRTAIARITTSGVVTEFPIGGNSLDQLQPTEIVAAPDGNLWFNQTHPSAPQGQGGRMSPNGAFTLFRLP